MLKAARGFVAVQNIDISEKPEDIAREFRERFYDTKLFWDPFAAGRFGAFLFKAVESPLVEVTQDIVHRLVEESQLFIEASHACRIELAKKGMNV
jgi:sulfite reductase (ferredoxin)